MAQLRVVSRFCECVGVLEDGKCVLVYSLNGAKNKRKLFVFPGFSAFLMKELTKKKQPYSFAVMYSAARVLEVNKEGGKRDLFSS